MKKIISIMIIFMMLLTLSVNAERPIKVIVGGENIITDVKPMTMNGRIMLPVRAVFEAIGAEVDYIAEEEKVIATKNNITVEFVINSNIMTINGEKKEIDVAATIKDNRTLVPLRACAEAFNLPVEWNEKTNTAKIKKPVLMLTEWSDEYGTIYRYTYDECGNKILEERKNQNNGEDFIVVERIEYDDMNNQVYGMVNNRVFGIFEIKIAYKYDEHGNIIYEENSRGQFKKYEYDENDNLTYFESSDGEWEKCEYDENNNLTYFESSNGSVVVYKYDLNGELICKEFDTKNEENRYRIYEKGNKYNTYSKGTKIEYKYDVNNMLVSSTEFLSSGLIISQMISSYNDKGNRIVTYSDVYHRLTSISEYDSNNRLIYECENKNLNSGDYQEYTIYKYDDNGNIIYREHSETSPYGNTHYIETRKNYYDDKNQMIKIEYDDNNITNYYYDDNGNIILEERIDEEGNLYYRETYKYDNNGNSISKECQSLKGLQYEKYEAIMK